MVYTVLHVDDNVSSLKSLQRQLRKEPYQLVSLKSTEDAVAIVRKVRFDLAILDVSMPGTNGFKLLKALRELDPKLQAVMLTGLVEDFVLYRLDIPGCIGFLPKPCEPEHLKRKIYSILRKHCHRKDKNQKSIETKLCIKAIPL